MSPLIFQRPPRQYCAPISAMCKEHSMTSMTAASSFESTMRTEITSMGLYFYTTLLLRFLLPCALPYVFRSWLLIPRIFAVVHLPLAEGRAHTLHVCHGDYEQSQVTCVCIYNKIFILVRSGNERTYLGKKKIRCTFPKLTSPPFILLPCKRTKVSRLPMHPFGEDPASFSCIRLSGSVRRLGPPLLIRTLKRPA